MSLFAPQQRIFPVTLLTEIEDRQDRIGVFVVDITEFLVMGLPTESTVASRRVPFSAQRTLPFGNGHHHVPQELAVQFDVVVRNPRFGFLPLANNCLLAVVVTATRLIRSGIFYFFVTVFAVEPEDLNDSLVCREHALRHWPTYARANKKSRPVAFRPR